MPLWQALARDGRVPFEVWYLTSHGTSPSRDREFEQTFTWDIDTLSSYPHRFLNVAKGATPLRWKCRLCAPPARTVAVRTGAIALWGYRGGRLQRTGKPLARRAQRESKSGCEVKAMTLCKSALVETQSETSATGVGCSAGSINSSILAQRIGGYIKSSAYQSSACYPLHMRWTMFVLRNKHQHCEPNAPNSAVAGVLPTKRFACSSVASSLLRSVRWTWSPPLGNFEGTTPYQICTCSLLDPESSERSSGKHAMLRSTVSQPDKRSILWHCNTQVVTLCHPSHPSPAS